MLAKNIRPRRIVSRVLPMYVNYSKQNADHQQLLPKKYFVVRPDPVDGINKIGKLILYANKSRIIQYPKW